jgi:hypothetical protein
MESERRIERTEPAARPQAPFQFSLKALWVFITLLCLALGYVVLFKGAVYYALIIVALFGYPLLFFEYLLLQAVHFLRSKSQRWSPTVLVLAGTTLVALGCCGWLYFTRWHYGRTEWWQKWIGSVIPCIYGLQSYYFAWKSRKS